jgi:hypothetical protein
VPFAAKVIQHVERRDEQHRAAEAEQDVGMRRDERDEQRERRPCDRIARVRDDRLDERDRARLRRPVPDDRAQEAKLLAHVAAVPPQEHLAQAPVRRRHQRVHDAGALIHAIEALPEDLVRHRAILAIRARTAEEALPDPSIEHVPHDARAIRRERAGTAIDRPVRALHGAQEVEREREAHLQHARDEPVAAIEHADLAGDGTDARVRERAGHREQCVGFDDAVGVDRHQHVATAAAESRLERRALAAVPVEAKRRHDVRVTARDALDVLPRVVDAAVVDDEHFEPLARVACAHDRFDRARDHLAFVVGRNDDGKRRRIGHRRQRRRAVAEPEQRAQHQHQHAHPGPEDRGTHDEAAPLVMARGADDAVKNVEPPAEIQHERKTEQDQRAIERIARQVAVVVEACRDAGGRDVGRHQDRGPRNALMVGTHASTSHEWTAIMR